MGDDGLTAGKTGLFEAPKEKWRNQRYAVREENGQLAISVDGAAWIGHKERDMAREDRHAAQRKRQESMFRVAALLPSSRE